MPAVDALERFRIAFAGRPLLLFFAVAALLWGVRRTIGIAPPPGRVRVATAAGIAAITAYAAAAIRYGLDPHYFDNAEPTMTAVGWLFAIGKPVYHGISSAERYAHVYGPASFMIQGWTLVLFGPSIAVSKFVGVAAGIGSIAALYAALRRDAGGAGAVVVAGLASLSLLMFRNYSFWTRPDPLLLLAASLVLVAATRLPSAAAAVAVGLLTALLWNLKFTGPFYAVPAFCLICRNGGTRTVAAAAAIATAAALVPFVGFANVSWANYATWIGLSGRTGLLMQLLRQNVEWAIFLAIPLIVALAAGANLVAPPERAAIAGLVCAMCAVVIAGAKPGAGPYHLIPFIPAICFLAVRVGRTSEAFHAPPSHVAAAFVAVLALEAAANQSLLLRTMRQWSGVSDAADVLQFARTHEGVAEIGYGQTEARSFARPLLVFRNGVYLLDQPAVREHQLAGVEIPPATARALDGCGIRYWLVPKGEQPFAGRNAYAAVLGQPLYPSGFVESFRSNYAAVETTAYFDVWACRSPATQAR